MLAFFRLKFSTISTITFFVAVAVKAIILIWGSTSLILLISL